MKDKYGIAWGPILHSKDYPNVKQIDLAETSSGTVRGAHRGECAKPFVSFHPRCLHLSEPASRTGRSIPRSQSLCDSFIAARGKNLCAITVCIIRFRTA